MSAGMTDYGAARDGGYAAADDLSSSTPKDHGSDLGKDHKDEKLDPELQLDQAVTVEEGSQKFSKLGWKRLTICLIVEAIALGSLSIPSAFATLGMVPGVILCVGLGLTAIYTSYVVGQVKLRYPAVEHYADAVSRLQPVSPAHADLLLR